MRAAGILPHEQVQVVEVTNGSRLETYASPAPRSMRSLSESAPIALAPPLGIYSSAKLFACPRNFSKIVTRRWAGSEIPVSDQRA